MQTQKQRHSWKLGVKTQKRRPENEDPQKFGVTPKNADPKTKIDLSLILFFRDNCSSSLLR